MDISFKARRNFLHGAAGVIAPLLATQAHGQSSAHRISLPPTAAATEPTEPPLEPVDAPADRVGFALVGLGHLTLERLMPAFGKSRHCKPVALVSGDRAKAGKLAAQYWNVAQGGAGSRHRPRPLVDGGAVIQTCLTHSMPPSMLTSPSRFRSNVFAPCCNGLSKCHWTNAAVLPGHDPFACTAFALSRHHRTLNHRRFRWRLPKKLQQRKPR